MAGKSTLKTGSILKAHLAQCQTRRKGWQPFPAGSTAMAGAAQRTGQAGRGLEVSAGVSDGKTGSGQEKDGAVDQEPCLAEGPNVKKDEFEIGKPSFWKFLPTSGCQSSL